MGPLLRMQTRLHFEDLPENMLPQWQQKIALRAENKRVQGKGTQRPRMDTDISGSDKGHTERTESTERG